MNALKEFERYVEEVTGLPVRVIALAAEERVGLPLYLSGLYQLQAAELFGQRWVLAVQEATGDETPAPSELVAHAEQLRRVLGAPVVLVLRHLTSYLRQQLMRRAVPFVAPGSQVFLPTAWVDLRERFARDRETKRATLSAAAQVVVLYHLLKAPVEGQSLRELAPKLGYSAMTLSKVADELASVELCRAETKSRSRMLCLTGARRELWERARPFLRSPVRARHWVVWNEPPPEARAAGLTALAARSMIADDRLPVFALNERDYRRLLESGRIRGCPGPDEAAAQVECWAYNPVLLGDEKAVDALSLVLSLADSPDERVQKALREVEATVW